MGASNSGAEIALIAAREHRTVLSGPDKGKMPVRPEGRLARLFDVPFWFFINRVATTDTPIGRKALPSCAIMADHSSGCGPPISKLPAWSACTRGPSELEMVCPCSTTVASWTSRTSSGVLVFARTSGGSTFRWSAEMAGRSRSAGSSRACRASTSSDCRSCTQALRRCSAASAAMRPSSRTRQRPHERTSLHTTRVPPSPRDLTADGGLPAAAAARSGSRLGRGATDDLGSTHHRISRRRRSRCSRPPRT